MKDRALDLRQEKLLSGTDDFALANNFAAQYAGAHPDVAKSSFSSHGLGWAVTTGLARRKT